MGKDEYLKYAQSVIDSLHNNPLYKGYFEEFKDCQTVLSVFQWLTVAVIVIMVVAVKYSRDVSQCKKRNLLLIISSVVLVGMIVYESLNFECMNSGFYGVPMGLQFILLLACLFMFCKKMNWKVLTKKVLFNSEGVKDKYLAIATRILNDAYHDRTVYYLDYLTEDVEKDIQHYKVRKLLSRYGRFEWDDYNKMWHSFRINADGIEFVESKKVLTYDNKICFSDLLAALLVLYVIGMAFWFLYVIVNVIIHIF